MTLDDCRHKGYLPRPTPLCCPKCGHLCLAYYTPNRGHPVGIFCSDCDWEQFPQIRHWPPESLAIARELRELKKEMESNE